jgi:hypothetical protein
MVYKVIWLTQIYIFPRAKSSINQGVGVDYYIEVFRMKRYLMIFEQKFDFPAIVVG